jgi:hypothetical protein
MRVINYKFTVAGIGGYIVKSNLYPLVSVDDRRSQGVGDYTLKGIDSNSSMGIKMPMSGVDSFGRFYVIPLNIEGDINGTKKQIQIPEAIINVSKKKNIVKTSLVGMSGTVKEYINDDDLDINITVGIVAVNAEGDIIDEYPKEGIEEFKEFLDTNSALTAQSEFLSMFGVDGGSLKIVVESYNIKQNTASNRQVIEIKAISDNDYTIMNEEF